MIAGPIRKSEKLLFDRVPDPGTYKGTDPEAQCRYSYPMDNIHKYILCAKANFYSVRCFEFTSRNPCHIYIQVAWFSYQACLEQNKKNSLQTVRSTVQFVQTFFFVYGLVICRECVCCRIPGWSCKMFCKTIFPECNMRAAAVNPLPSPPPPGGGGGGFKQQ